MSYQEKTISVSLFSSILIMVYYLSNIIPMYREDSLSSARVFSLWGMVIALAIIVNILGNILTMIMFSIIDEIREKEEESLIEDERDKLIELKGTKITYIVSSLGVFVSMLSFVLGQPPLVMFSLLIATCFVAEIIGGAFRLFRYRRGF
jgi:hypothetical protein